ncbi:hypothetical protein DWU95_46650, partial [Burkholderia contaminans]
MRARNDERIMGRRRGTDAAGKETTIVRSASMIRNLNGRGGVPRNGALPARLSRVGPAGLPHGLSCA